RLQTRPPNARRLFVLDVVAVIQAEAEISPTHYVAVVTSAGQFASGHFFPGIHLVFECLYGEQVTRLADRGVVVDGANTIDPPRHRGLGLEPDRFSCQQETYALQATCSRGDRSRMSRH